MKKLTTLYKTAFVMLMASALFLSSMTFAGTEPSTSSQVAGTANSSTDSTSFSIATTAAKEEDREQIRYEEEKEEKECSRPMSAKIIGGYPGYYNLKTDSLGTLKLRLSSFTPKSYSYLLNCLIDALNDSGIVTPDDIQKKLIKEFIWYANQFNPGNVSFDFENMPSTSTLEDYKQHVKSRVTNEKAYNTIIYRFENDKGVVNLINPDPIVCAYAHRWEKMHFKSFEYNKLKSYINNMLMSDDAESAELYRIFVETDFLIPLDGLKGNVKLPIKFDPILAIKDFIQQNGRFDTLILGNGCTYDNSTSDRLNLPPIGCGMVPVTSEDFKAKALWVDMQFCAHPDIMGDIDDPNLYLAIKYHLGENCLKQISERSWGGKDRTDEIFGLISSLLMPGGIFEIIFSYDYSKDNADMEKLIARLKNVGLECIGYNKERNALLFKKPTGISISSSSSSSSLSSD